LSVLLVSPVFGVDLELSSRLDNLYWSPQKLDTPSGHQFTGADLFYNFEGSVTQEIGDGLQFRGGIAVDPILRSRAYAQLNFAVDNLNLAFTPFLGTFNSTQKWFDPGLSALVEYSWPGFLFVRGGFLTTFAPVAKSGDYYLSSLTAAVGGVLENGIVTFTIEDKSATFRTSDVLTTVDSSTKYWLDTEMFLKNFPLRWAILTGYQVTGRSYIAAAETATTVHSALLGLRLSWDIGSGTVLYLQGESALFTVGWNETTLAVPSNQGLYQVVAGVRYHW
jgi:hypothetical protein